LGLGVDAKIGSPHFDVFEIYFLVNHKNDNNYKVLSEYLDVYTYNKHLQYHYFSSVMFSIAKTNKKPSCR